VLGEPWIERGRPAWSLDGRVFVHVNPPSLRTAVGLVLSDRADRIVMATMLPGDLNRLWECVTRRRQTPEDMFELVADGLVAHWFGRPRWETERLWDQALGQWASVDGELLRGGVRLETLSPTRATNVVWSLLAKWNFRGEDGEQWLSELTRKPFRQVRPRN
jgi:hypothetical protein